MIRLLSKPRICSQVTWQNRHVMLDIFGSSSAQFEQGRNVGHEHGSAPKGRFAAHAIYSTVCPFISESGNQDSPNVNNSSALELFISSSEKPVCSRNLGFQATNEWRSKSTIALGNANSFKIAHNCCKFWVERSIPRLNHS